MDEHHDHHHHQQVQGQEDQAQDLAGASLSDALRLSFRILTVIMIAFLCAFLASSVSCIDTQQIGIKKVFGKVVGTSAPGGGLTVNWFWPIGEIVKVQVTPRDRAVVTDFWTDGVDDPEPRTFDAGLRTGMDGALLSGDRSLLHAKISYRYAVQRPEEYVRGLAHLRDASSYDVGKDPDLDELVRYTVCNAALSAAAGQTAENIRLNLELFRSRTEQGAQQQLNEVFGDANKTVVRLSNLTVNVYWPGLAKKAYDEASKTSMEYQQKRSEAIKEAHNLLNAAAGQAYKQLVGERWDALTETGGDWNLIGQYGDVRARLTQAQQDLHKATQPAAKAAQEQLVLKYQKQADALLVRIDYVLLSDQIGGDARKKITEAQSSKTGYIASVQAREQGFRDILAQYNRSPQLTLERLWADTRDAVMASNLVEKLYVTLDENGQTNVQIRRDPDIVRQIDGELLRLKQGAKKPEDQKPK